MYTWITFGSYVDHIWIYDSHPEIPAFLDPADHAAPSAATAAWCRCRCGSRGPPTMARHGVAVVRQWSSGAEVYGCLAKIWKHIKKNRSWLLFRNKSVSIFSYQAISMIVLDIAPRVRLSKGKAYWKSDSSWYIDDNRDRKAALAFFFKVILSFPGPCHCFRSRDGRTL